MNESKSGIPHLESYSSISTCIHWIIGPGFLVCMLAQVLSIFNPVEDLASKPDGEIPEKVSNISFISPEASWISWFVIALFFWAPPLFSAWILGRKRRNSRFVSRAGEMGLRLIGIPGILLGISLLLNFPVRLLAVWTVFHYSLALISSMVAEYRMQYCIPE